MCKTFWKGEGFNRTYKIEAKNSVWKKRQKKRHPFLTDKRSYAQNCEAKVILDRSVLTEGQPANQATRQPPRWPSRHCGVGFGWWGSNPVGIWAPAYTQELYGPQRYWLFELGSKRVGLETIWIEVTHVLLSRVKGPTKEKPYPPFSSSPSWFLPIINFSIQHHLVKAHIWPAAQIFGIHMEAFGHLPSISREDRPCDGCDRIWTDRKHPSHSKPAVTLPDLLTGTY